MGNRTSSSAPQSPRDSAQDEASGVEPEREPSETITLSRLEALPADIKALLIQCLLGSDVLRLASCNHQLFKALRDDSVWRHRLWTNSTMRVSRMPKDLYVQARSLFFRGHFTKDHQGGVEAVQMPLALFPKHRDISFDIWFALVPPDDHRVGTVGGVLVAAQDVKAPLGTSASSRHRFRTTTPLQWEIFAFVDENRNLYCSVLSHKPVLAEQLQFNRWYHLALVYDHERQHQQVYLDGAVVNCQEGEARWPWLQFAQLGSGFVAGASGGGWTGFRGLIDEFRVCYLPWTTDQVRRLAQGRHTNAPMAYALSRDLCRCDHGGKRLEVSCTRPAERHVEIMGCGSSSSVTTARGIPCRGMHGCGPQPIKNATLWKLLRQCL